MAIAGLSRRSIRDLSANLVPLAILLFFGIWFALDAPWGWDLPSLLVFYGLVGHLFVLLAVLTYVLARRIQTIEGHDP